MGHVYVVENKLGMVKIGRSINPEQRIRNIETQSGLKIIKKYISEDYENFYKLETLSLRNLTNPGDVGEWVSHSFDKAVDSVKEIITKIGIKKAETENKYCSGSEVSRAETVTDILNKHDNIYLNERANFMLLMHDYLPDAVGGIISWEDAFMSVYKILSQMASFRGDITLYNKMNELELGDDYIKHGEC